MGHPMRTDDGGRRDLLRVVEDEPAINDSRMQKLVLVGPRGQVVCDVCHLANRTHTRMRGVIGWRHLRRGEGILLRPTFSIHTAFVRFAIDAVFLDRELKVLSTAENMKPWRLAGYWGANSVLELPAGECERLGVAAGDRLAWGQI
jgi:uncharacterized membrane protein (UPF0127 family)